MTPLDLNEDDLNLRFPEPAGPLLEGPGPPVPWSEWMDQTAAQTIYYLKHYGHLPPPPPPEEPFRLDLVPPFQGAPSRSFQGGMARLLEALPPGAELSASELMLRLGLRHRGNFRARYLDPALQAGLIQRSQPGRPSSPRQRYRRAQPDTGKAGRRRKAKDAAGGRGGLTPGSGPSGAGCPAGLPRTRPA